MSVQAYQAAIRKTASPRDVEYQLLSKVTAALKRMVDTGREDFRALVETLDWNRRVWSALALDCSNPENQLPEETRAGIISLSLFVGRHSSKVLRDGEDIETLIDINRTIMEGLASMGGNAPEAETAAKPN